MFTLKFNETTNHIPTMPLHGIINSIFIMQLTKQQLIEAHEQGLSVKTYDNNKLKIVANILDIFAIQFENSSKVEWFSIDKFNILQCTIEQHKPKYNGQAVKCDSVEQANWLLKKLGENYTLDQYNIDNKSCINLTGTWDYEQFYINNNYDIISFSQYCVEQGIKEPQWIQGFEAKDGYNDVVMASNDKENWILRRLIVVRKDDTYPFIGDSNIVFKYCRYPRKNEINEIKFID